MRARNIKPGFFKDGDLVECSFAARLLSTGLWMLADREGRLHDKPKQIKMEIFPADSIDIEELLLELHTHKHIIRYEIDGVKYIQIRKFTDHQSPHFTEKDSLIPPPISDDFQKNIPSRNPSSEEIPKALPPDSLIPDSLIPEKKESKQQRGSRFALTELPDDWRHFCQEKRSDLNPDEVFAEFKDFWSSVPGQRGCKLDWFATWRNRVREKKSAPAVLFKSFDQQSKQKTDLAIEEARKKYANPT